MTRQLHPCGTPGAYRRHKRHGEPVDAACREAEQLYRRGGKPRTTRETPEHGTTTMYSKHGCKCETCTEAHRVRHAAWREQAAQLPFDQIPHGANGYSNYRCRCEVCKGAGSRKNAAYRASQKQVAA